MRILVLIKLSVDSRASALHPKDKNELIMCLNNKICSGDKKMYRTHVTVMMYFKMIVLCYARMVFHTLQNIVY